MWESPVNVIYGEMQTQIEGDTFKAIQNVGIDVNEEELLKALQYDREQYSKGYSEGYAKAIEEFAERLRLECLNSCFKEVHMYRILEVAEEMRGAK